MLVVRNVLTIGESKENLIVIENGDMCVENCPIKLNILQQKTDT